MYAQNEGGTMSEKLKFTPACLDKAAVILRIFANVRMAAMAQFQNDVKAHDHLVAVLQDDTSITRITVHWSFNDL